jgi:hypothetical protein
MNMVAAIALLELIVVAPVAGGCFSIERLRIETRLGRLPLGQVGARVIGTNAYSIGTIAYQYNRYQ